MHYFANGFVKIDCTHLVVGVSAVVSLGSNCAEIPGVNAGLCFRDLNFGVADQPVGNPAVCDFAVLPTLPNFRSARVPIHNRQVDLYNPAPVGAGPNRCQL